MNSCYRFATGGGKRLATYSGQGVLKEERLTRKVDIPEGRIEKKPSSNGKSTSRQFGPTLKKGEGGGQIGKIQKKKGGKTYLSLNYSMKQTRGRLGKMSWLSGWETESQWDKG